MNLQQTIHKFISSNHLPEPNIKVDMPMVFFHSKEEPIPALVREVQQTANGICANLTVYLPDQTREVSGIGSNSLNINYRYYLREEVRARVYLTYPEIVFTKQAQELATPQQGDNVTQTHTDLWLPSDISQQPRLYGIQTNQVGKFFDPRFYKFQIFCHKDPFREVHTPTVVQPAEDLVLPASSAIVHGTVEAAKGLMGLLRKPQGQQGQVSSSSYYDTFFSCYEEFFKQKYQLIHSNGTARWDSVEIRASYKQGSTLDDYREPVEVVEQLSGNGIAQMIAG